MAEVALAVSIISFMLVLAVIGFLILAAMS